MKILANHAEKALTLLVKGLKFAINVQVGVLQMERREQKSARYAHEVSSL